ncbi:HdeD family acid-resistance protein [Tengunoibacter tsumagoiensis]|nr:DUF308 domain-containing protein [Tengunoibacter tsumagoiensis]
MMIRSTSSSHELGFGGTPWWLALLEGVALLIIGLLLLFSPGLTLLVLVQTVGFYWLISGILALVSLFVDQTFWGLKLFAGILGILAGFAVIRNPLWSLVLLPTLLILLLGIQGLINGVLKLWHAFQGGGIGMGVLGGVNIIFGLILVLRPLIALAVFPYVLGVFAVVGGILAIAAAFRVRSAYVSTADQYTPHSPFLS